ncbi:DUF5949 family protein [Streptomyces sp. NPDC048606]|uniref:DUF5949 family protein n=1 Tax=Streptomyces sp. NPDC048606 TaxID=3154726 RepID=UPI0034228C5B
MTSTQAETDRSQLGTLSVLAWIGDPSEGHDMPYLLAYPLGDGPQGPQGSEGAARGLLADMGLRIGDVVEDGTANPHKFQVKVVLADNQIALTLPGLNVTCTAPDEWVEAARESGRAYFLFSTRSWPEAVPGKPVTEEALREFAGDEAVLNDCAHCLVTVQSLQK